MLAGIDPHKDTLAIAVIDAAGRPHVVTNLANTEAGFDDLEALLANTTSTGSVSRDRATTAAAPPSDSSWPAACRSSKYRHR